MGLDPFIGTIHMFGGNFAPRGYAFCNGQLLQIAQNTALFSILGTTYGGDGRTTFGLPDLRGRVPVHAGSGPGLSRISLGEKGGNASTILNMNNLPAHAHDVALKCNTNAGSSNDPEGNAPTASGANLIYGDQNPREFMLSTSTSSVGSAQSFENRGPFQAVNFIIALIGLYPSRN